MSVVSESFSTLDHPVTVAPVSADGASGKQLAELHDLLRNLEAATAAGHSLPPVFSEEIDDRLVQARLGVASGLFAAMQCRNAATAGHALRVALTCSAWAVRMNLPDDERDAIEIAALLHDIGIIGVPDQILLKPGALDANEAAVMARSRLMSQDILRRGCRLPRVLEIAENVSARFDGSRPECPLAGLEIPRGARMIAIAEAFDAMTTDHVYRPARSEERAMAELFACAGTQFDPELVEQFAEFRRSDTDAGRWETADRWLRSLDTASSAAVWGPTGHAAPSTAGVVGSAFQGRLLDNMYDGVVFVDAAGRVVLWNRGAERLTGIAAGSACGRAWRPEMLGLSDEKHRAIAEADCPVHTAIRCGAQSLRRLTIVGRTQRHIDVDVHAIPVIDPQGITQGAILLMHDASSETSLERQCHSLHDKATKDPLTQVANRAEFDRVHAMFVAAHQQQHVPCSLMMCDLDRFKLVNDTYGHQAGDDAIICLASLLKSSCRPGDLVARYGGEEFVMLCANCDNATAARRANQIRESLSRIAQPKMGGRSVTVSFGVTEIQPGDSPETMLRRADRALLMAKANGRNAVVQLGAGGVENEPAAAKPKASVNARGLMEQVLVSPAPMKIAIEKLRGFVADHQARVVLAENDRARLVIGETPPSRSRRQSDRPNVFTIDVSFEERRAEADRASDAASPAAGVTQTIIHVSIATQSDRDRRTGDTAAQARDLLISLRAYLMASEQESKTSVGAIGRAKRIFAPWLGHK